MTRKLSLVHPGEVLREDFLKPMQLSPMALARAVNVPRTRIERVVNAQTPITADTALRLGKALRTTAAFWMGMQAQYDLERAEDELGDDLRAIEAALVHMVVSQARSAYSKASATKTKSKATHTAIPAPGKDAAKRRRQARTRA
jgi:addiction module HigA family antidote